MLLNVNLVIKNIFLLWKCFLLIYLCIHMVIIILWGNNGSCHISSGISITMMDILSIKSLNSEYYVK